MDNNIIVEFRDIEKNTSVDIEVPLDITANDLIIALNTTYNLGLDVDNIFNCYLTSENPIAFLRGNRCLSEYEIRNGTVLYFRRG